MKCLRKLDGISLQAEFGPRPIVSKPLFEIKIW